MLDLKMRFVNSPVRSRPRRFPHVVGDTGGHRGRQPRRFVNAREVVVIEVRRNGCRTVLQLFGGTAGWRFLSWATAIGRATLAAPGRRTRVPGQAHPHNAAADSTDKTRSKKPASRASSWQARMRAACSSLTAIPRVRRIARIAFASPLASPSRSPSSRPLASPSRSPLASPSRSPTTRPYSSPLASPSRSPSWRPSSRPLVSPSRSPRS